MQNGQEVIVSHVYTLEEIMKLKKPRSSTFEVMDREDSLFKYVSFKIKELPKQLSMSQLRQ